MEYPEIANEIITMAQQDQLLRFDKRPLGDKDKEDEIKRTNQEYELKIRAIIKKIGWPTISKVGREASFKAWLLVQHHSEEFQKESLELMEKVYAENMSEIDPQNIAYLKDKILVRQNSKQLYGTQAKKASDGKFYIFPIEDRAHVNERRKAVGLNTLEEYMNGDLFQGFNLQITDDLTLFP